MMQGVVTCVLPAGFLDADGVCHRQARLRGIVGQDEMRLHELPPQATVTEAITRILLLAVRTIGPYRLTPELASALVPADRDYLVRTLWQITFSSRIDAVLTCPGCGMKMNADCEMDTLPVPSKPQERSYAVCIDGLNVFFRLPQSADIELVTSAVYDGRDRVAALLARCLTSIGGMTGVTEEAVASFPAEFRRSLDAAIEHACPDTGLELEASCPNCDRRFDADFDVASNLLVELLKTRSELMRSIHLLSFHYHWPLREILSLSTGARRQYVRLLIDNLGSASAMESAGT